MAALASVSLSCITFASHEGFGETAPSTRSERTKEGALSAISLEMEWWSNGKEGKSKRRRKIWLPLAVREISVARHTIASAEEDPG